MEATGAGRRQSGCGDVRPGDGCRAEFPDFNARREVRHDCGFQRGRAGSQSEELKPLPGALALSLSGVAIELSRRPRGDPFQLGDGLVTTFDGGPIPRLQGLYGRVQVDRVVNLRVRPPGLSHVVDDVTDRLISTGGFEDAEVTDLDAEDIPAEDWA